MGNTPVKEANQNSKLLIRNALLERQIRQQSNLDPSVKHAIQDVKKNRLYKNLVLSGGGLKGIAHIGALEYLHNNRYLTNIENISCSSAGSLFGVLYAIGYTIPEIKKIALNMDYHKLCGINKDLVSDIFHVATEYGINNGQYLIDTITKHIEKQTGNKNYTFGQLWKEKGINLVITGTDIVTKNTLYFWYGKYAKMPIRIAVRISCSLPPLFCPVIFDGHYLVDGGMLDNCPIHVFDGAFPADPLAKMNMTPIDPHTLAILLNSEDEKNTQIKDVMGFYGAVLDAMVDNGVERYQRPSFWQRTVPVQLPSIPMYKNISMSQINNLIECGYKDTERFFHG